MPKMWATLQKKETRSGRPNITFLIRKILDVLSEHHKSITESWRKKQELFLKLTSRNTDVKTEIHNSMELRHGWWRSKSVLNAFAIWRTKRLTNFSRFPHFAWTITKYNQKIWKLWETCQGVTCSQICVHMLVFGKNWKTRLTLDSKLRGKICHKVEASVRFSTRTSHEWPSSHIQLQIGFSRWESSNRLQTGLIPRRRFCRKSDGLNVNNKKSDDTSPYYDAHHICSKQFVSLFSDCDFF